jgi:hypothetical protein
MTFQKYGAQWPAGATALEIEFCCIQKGGRWFTRGGKECGAGLLEHYLNARALLWPKRYRHRWTELIYQQVLTNDIVILAGSASSQKTSHLSELALISYWCFPKNTCVLVSTISIDKLEGAVFGEIKMLFQSARERFPDLAGHVIDHKHCIATDNVKEDDVRDLRKGIRGVPLYVGNKYVGLGVLAGIKQERFWFIADELQYCPSTFLDCLPNMRSNTGGGGLKVLGSGNLNHDPESQLGIVAEPLDGWSSVEENTKTTVWPIKLSGGVCVNLIGTDSPNFDGPEDEPDKFPRLIGRDFERIIAHDYGRNSPQYETQVMGRMKLGLAHSRVITRQLCRQHHAHDVAQWEGLKRTKVHYTDPAYGGGDRCVTGWAEFGNDPNGNQILRINPPRIIKINLKLDASPEDQIAAGIKSDLDGFHIEVENAGYDSFGKGTVGFALARVFGERCPVPINAGEQCTKRPVRSGLFVIDKNTGEKRLKRCDEHYSKFITEMWFSVRYAIEAEQIRELPMDVMAEGCWREYYDTAGAKIEVEPKDKMKERMGKSPDLFDHCAGLVEMARRAGFMIEALGDVAESTIGDDWLDLKASEYDRILKSKMLHHAL